MTSPADLKSFILRSTYRVKVIRSLARSSQQTPTLIAKKTDIRQPHVSRTLSELQERDLVSLVVSENQHKGRLYELTHLGEDIWSEIQVVNWQGTIDSVPDSHRNLVAFLQDELGDQLIAAGSYNGIGINNYYLRDSSQNDFSKEKFADTVETLVEEHGRSDTNIREIAGRLHYEVQSFTGFHRVVIYTDEGFIGAALDPDCHFEYPVLIEKCLDELEK